MPIEGAAPVRRRGLLEASSDLRVGRALEVRSLVFDVLVALILVALGLLLLEVFTQHPSALDRTFAVGVNAPLALRRRLPRTAFGLAYGVGLAQVVAGSRIGMHDAGLLFALYSAVGCSSTAFGLWALGVGVLTAVAGALTGWWVWVDRQLSPDPGLGARLASLAGALVLVGCSWALGRRLWTARLGSMALAERAALAERDREQQAALAAADERARIAREMHDVVAHGLTVMVVQADAAGLLLDRRPADARRAVEQIATTGRESMAQMRSLLGLLREGPDARAAPPGLADVDDLVEQARRAGAEVTLHLPDIAGVTDVMALVALTAYRVVQEGLTNARKHGGRMVAVEIERQARAGSTSVLLVRVSNDPPPDGGRTLGAEPDVRSGLGLQGARERVAAVHGTLDAGRQPDGRFVLTAELPLTGPAQPGGSRAEPAFEA